jgi:hypothetical protein
MKSLLLFLIIAFPLISYCQYDKLPFLHTEIDLPKWITDPQSEIDDADECMDVEIEFRVICKIHSFDIYYFEMTGNGCEAFIKESAIVTVNSENKAIDWADFEAYSAGEYSRILGGELEIAESCIISEYSEQSLSYEYDYETQTPGETKVVSQYNYIAKACISVKGEIITSLNTEQVEIINEYEKTEEEKVTEIREQFNLITANIKIYTVKSVKVSENESFTAYLDNSDIMKIARVFNENGTKITQEYFYFDNGQSCFVLETKNTNPKEINRYYLYNKELIRWLDTDKKRVADSYYIRKYSELYNNSTSMLRIVRP